MKGIALVALLLSSGAYATETPLSAIPWLSESIRIESSPPPARPQAEPPRRGEEITVTTLGAVSRDAVGLLSSEQTGFSRDLWGPTDANEARTLILRHPEGGVPAARALFRRVLLAEADTPDGAGSESELLLARIDRLLERGSLEEARALIERAGPDTPDLFRRWFDIGLLLSAAEAPCEALRQNPMLSPTLPARVFCLARGGDWNAAEITLTLGEHVGVIPEPQEALLARCLDPEIVEGEPAPPVPDPLTPLDFLMREAVGLPRPQGPLPQAFVHLDLHEHAPMRARVEAAERLILTDAITPGKLIEGYRAGKPAASGGAWERASAVQALDAALAADPVDPDALSEALKTATTLMAARGLDVALAEAYADALAVQEAGRLDPAARHVLVRLLLRAGRIDAAVAAAGHSPDAGAATLLAVAGHGSPAADPGDLALAALAGLGATAPNEEREHRLATMIDEGRQGEAIITALDLLEAEEGVDPVSLRTALFALKQAGQEEAARVIALQTLIRAGV